MHCYVLVLCEISASRNIHYTIIDSKNSQNCYTRARHTITPNTANLALPAMEIYVGSATWGYTTKMPQPCA